MDDLPVVQVWREINGVNDDGDFVFFFSSFEEEAKQEVGDLIATAWQHALQQAHGGVDKVVQAMLAREEKPSPPAPQVRQPAPSIKVKPSSAPRVVRQVEKPPSPKEPFRQSLQEIAVNASWFKLRRKMMLSGHAAHAYVVVGTD